MSESAERSKWGRVKFGNGRWPAMAVAAPIGVVIGFALSMVAVWADIAGPNPVLGAAVFTLCLAVLTTFLAYIVVVDRSTMEGTSAQPEESIESRWYLKAAAGAQTDVIAAAAVATLVISLVPFGAELDPRIALVGVIGVSFASFSVRHHVLRRAA